MARLYAESFAPWCEKARWALDSHRVPYEVVEHVPLIGEPLLRIAARKPTGRVTVPLLVDGDTVLTESFDIARHADRVGSGAPLFPAGYVSEVARWNDRSDALMTAGRALLLGRMLESPSALIEQLPPFVPAALRAPMRPISSFGVRYLMKKYGIGQGDDARYEAAIRRELDGLRAALGGRKHLLGEGFSYADIAMATSLQFLRPVDERFIALGPATRDAWTEPALAAAYGDVLRWRDALYVQYR